MSDWELTDQRIYQLLKHPHHVEESKMEEMTIAYLDFVEGLFSYINKEDDKKELIRKLNTSYIDFGALKELEETEPTKNSRLKITFLNKLMSLLDMETNLIYRQMENPKFFINIDTEWKSPLCLNSDVIRLVDIMEIVCGFFYLENGLQRLDSKKLNLTDVSTIFEKMFNMKIGNIYKKEEAVIERNSPKITEFLDRLKAAIIRVSKEKGHS
jgi:hypothetical protein